MFLKEVYANGLLIISRKNALTVTLNHARFTNSAIAYNHHLKHNKKNKMNFWHNSQHHHSFLLMDHIMRCTLLIFSHFFVASLNWPLRDNFVGFVRLTGCPRMFGTPSVTSLKSWLKITIQDSLIICGENFGWKIPHWSGIERKLQHNVRRWYMMKTVI